MYLFMGEIVPFAPIYYPGINEKTVGGFIVLAGYQTLVISMAFVAASACDFLLTLLIINVPIMAELIEMEIQTLNDILSTEKIDVPMVKFKLRNILLMHRETTE